MSQGQSQAGVALQKDSSVGGVSQSVDLSGRTFHFQTQAYDGAVRTEVFLGGRLLVSREALLDGMKHGRGKKSTKERVQEHHERTVSGIRRRIRRFQECRLDDSGAKTPAAPSEAGERGLDLHRLLEKGEIERLGSYLAGLDGKAASRPFGAEVPLSEFDGREANDHGKELPGLSGPGPGVILSESTDLQTENHNMAQVNLEPLATIDGFVGACLVDSESGMMLGAFGGGSVNLELAAAGNTQVVRAKRKTVDSLQLNDDIEDILISLAKQYHLIRPLVSNPQIFLYVMLDRAKANLGMARHELKAFEAGINVG